MKSATNSPCRFSGLKARASRVFGGLFGSKKLGVRAFILVIVTCLGVSVAAPMAEDAAAFEDGQKICYAFSYTSQLIVNAANVVKKMYACSEVTADGKIKGEVLINNQLEDIILKYYPGDVTYSTEQTGGVLHSFSQIRDGATITLRYHFIAMSVGKLKAQGDDVSYNIGETALQDVASSIRSSLDSLITDTSDMTWILTDVRLEEDEDVVRIAMSRSSIESSYNVGDECEDLTSLGWIICPIINGISDAVKSVYENMIEPLLVIDTEILTADTSLQGNSVRIAWQIFQNAANIFLVILIILVIFSQLTGVGIDNYGIKKALPKLIVAVVLINLSYFLCQILVDLANILGYSLQAMFENLAADMVSNASTTSSFLSSLGGTITSGAIIAGIVAAFVLIPGAAAGLAFLIVSNIPIIVSLMIATLISILFFFIILAVRKAGLILMIVIAPLAFACYILPNTKKLFDKWVKIFTALILLYPICGLLVGGASFASTLMLSLGENNFGTAVIALLVNIVPIFFIPTILKTSMAGLGNLGAKISGIGSQMGRRLGGAAQKGIQNNARYQSAVSGRRSRFHGVLADAVENEAKNSYAKKHYNGKKYNELTEAERKDVDANFAQEYTEGQLRRLERHVSEVERDGAGLIKGRAIAEAGLENHMEAAGAAALFNARQAEQKLQDWNKDYYTEDAEDISFKEGDKEHRFRKYADGKIDYLNEQREASNDEKKELKKRIDSGQATKSKTKLQFVKKGQDWVTADGKSIKRYSQDQIGQKVAAGQGVMTSYGETKQIEAETAHDQELGKMAGFAGMAEGEVIDLGHRKMMTAATETEISNQRAVTNGQENVLQVQRNEAQTAINQTVGKAQATQELNKQGYSTVGSARAAQNAAEGQLINTITQNVAAPNIRMDATQIGEAVATGTTTLRNQFETTTQGNEVGVTSLTPAMAKARAVASRLATESKAWSDQVEHVSSNEVSDALKEALAEDRSATTDSERIAATAKMSAAFNKLASSGNLPILHQIFGTDGATSGMSDIMWNQFNQDAIKSPDVLFKQFAKQSFIAQSKGATQAPDMYKFNTGQNQNLKDANGNSINVKGMDQTMNDNLHALDNQDKDTIEAITNNMKIRVPAPTPSDPAATEFLYKGKPPIRAKHLVSAAASTNDTEVLARLDNAIKQYGKLLDKDTVISEFAGAINGSTLAKLSSDVVDAILIAAGAVRQNGTIDQAEVKKIFGSAIRDIEKSEQLMASTSNAVRDKLKIGTSSGP